MHVLLFVEYARLSFQDTFKWIGGDSPMNQEEKKPLPSPGPLSEVSDVTSKLQQSLTEARRSSFWDDILVGLEKPQDVGKHKFGVF